MSVVKWQIVRFSWVNFWEICDWITSQWSVMGSVMASVMQSVTHAMGSVMMSVMGSVMGSVTRSVMGSVILLVKRLDHTKP